VSAALADPFLYPSGPHVRRHGPQGYADDKYYKPWLRDDFSFRCVYCLCRETWYPDGEAHFSIEHTRPRSAGAAPGSTYDNLVYACCVCNAYKRDFADVLDLSQVAVAGHLEALPDGPLRAFSPQGEALIQVCALNRPTLVAFRRDLHHLLALLASGSGVTADRLRRRYFGYPEVLPDLAALRPPGGNTRPDGVGTSCFERSRRGELADTY
jgi:hypothetical protein